MTLLVPSTRMLAYLAPAAKPVVVKVLASMSPVNAKFWLLAPHCVVEEQYNVVMPGLVDVNAFTKMNCLAVATLFCVVNVEFVLAKLIDPAKLAANAAPDPVAVKPKL